MDSSKPPEQPSSDLSPSARRAIFMFSLFAGFETTLLGIQIAEQVLIKNYNILSGYNGVVTFSAAGLMAIYALKVKKAVKGQAEANTPKPQENSYYRENLKARIKWHSPALKGAILGIILCSPLILPASNLVASSRKLESARERLEELKRQRKELERQYRDLKRALPKSNHLKL